MRQYILNTSNKISNECGCILQNFNQAWLLEQFKYLTFFIVLTYDTIQSNKRTIITAKYKHQIKCFYFKIL